MWKVDGKDGPRVQPQGEGCLFQDANPLWVACDIIARYGDTHSGWAVAVDIHVQTIRAYDRLQTSWIKDAIPIQVEVVAQFTCAELVGRNPDWYGWLIDHVGKVLQVMFGVLDKVCGVWKHDIPRVEIHGGGWIEPRRIDIAG